MDIAARIGELGRQPYTSRWFITQYADRVLFGTDVSPNAKTYRTYKRRADVLMEWARCELARGYFQRAQSLLKQVMRSYPKQRKAAKILLAQVRTRWSQSKLASQRYRRAVRRKPRARPARRTRRAAPPQATESSKGDAY